MVDKQNLAINITPPYNNTMQTKTPLSLFVEAAMPMLALLEDPTKAEEKIRTGQTFCTYSQMAQNIRDGRQTGCEYIGNFINREKTALYRRCDITDVKSHAFSMPFDSIAWMNMTDAIAEIVVPVLQTEDTATGDERSIYTNAELTEIIKSGESFSRRILADTAAGKRAMPIV